MATPVPGATASSPSKPRKTWVDAVRGVAICLVVLGHVIQFGSHDRFDYFTDPAFVTIYSFHMPLFMLVSGYLAHGALDRSSWPQLVRSRLRTIIVPMVCWTVLSVVVGAVFSLLEVGRANVARMARGVIAALVYPERGLWFLWVLFLCYCIAGAAFRAPRRLRWPALAMATVVVWAVPLDLPLAWTQLKWTFPFFLAGLAARQLRGLLVRAEHGLLVASVAGYALLRTAWHRDDTVYLNRMHLPGSPATVLGHLAFRYGIATCGCLAVICLVRLACRHARMGLAARLGAASMGIYTVQQVLAVHLMDFWAPRGAAYHWVFVPLVAAAVVAVSYRLALLLELSSVTRVLLLGGRGAKPAVGAASVAQGAATGAVEPAIGAGPDAGPPASVRRAGVPG